MKKINFDNFNDFVYYDEYKHEFFDSRETFIVRLEDADDDFIEQLKGCVDGHQAICLLLIGYSFSTGNTAEDALQDFYENDYNEASFGDTMAQAIVDELEDNINNMDEEQLIYTYDLIKIGESVAVVGE